MGKLQLKIADHLLIPFARPKWSIERIKIIGVSTNATYIQSETPLVYINKAEKSALRLRHFSDVFPEEMPDAPTQPEAIAAIRKHLKETCNLDTDSEKRFLELYLDYCAATVVPTEWELRSHGPQNLAAPKNDPDWVFDALLPLPQAHLYVSDPLAGRYSFVPENMVKVDFAFWTGTQIVAVEIDGASHVGSAAHVRKDRILQGAGVSVIHIMNSELLQHGKKVISHLFPASITQYWKWSPYSIRSNPLIAIPF
ncbi:MAG: endonuclease domain-containing protein [Pseudomonadota bacterium]|nr:endonuclease domain-containing protein [Pseudomonadota bacterium]